MNPSVITAVAMGIALSATCGFRVFVPLLAASVAAHFNLYNTPTGMQWLSTWPVMIGFAVAAVAEIAAYYIPFVDNLLDTIATPLAVAAGTVVAASFLPLGTDEAWIRWMAALVAGGAPAGVLQLGTGVLRLLSSKTTAGAGNVVLSSAENGAAIGSSVLALLIPVIAAIILLLLIFWLLIKFGARLFRTQPKPV